MDCTHCSAAVRPGQRFCAQCGHAVVASCPGCQAPVRPGERFCAHCGHALPAVAAEPRDDAGERRQLTVLFADLVGSTPLSRRLDPEAFREVLGAYQDACAAAVIRFGGQVRQFLGDGVLAYFGFPMAHENDADRAVRAGLAIVDAVGALRVAATQTALQVRVGIHTGIVVVGALNTRRDQGLFAFGDVPNVAARIQSEAAPDTVCIGRATLALVDGRYETRSLGERTMKGSGRVELFAVVGAAVSAGHGHHAVGPTLVGRAHELQVLAGQWGAARAGAGRAVMIVGEAGLGKSRLLAEFRGMTDAAEWIVLRGTPYDGNSAFQPVIDRFADADVDAAARPRSTIAVRQADDEDARRLRLRALLAAVGPSDEIGVGLVGELLGLVASAEVGDRSPQQRKRRLIDALVAWLLAPARTRPAVLLCEDVHWFDASTIELIGELLAVALDPVARLPVLVLLTFRPQFVPPWTSRTHLSTVALARLTADESRAIVRGLVGGDDLPDAIVEQIQRRADGVPLFVEEITKNVVEAGRLANDETSLKRTDTGLAGFDVPATLRDSLTARLDRLGPAKGTAQVAAVLGREFDYALLHAVSGIGTAELEDRLDVLRRADILLQDGLASRARYAFRHALIQEAAYETLLLSARQSHHARTARVYVERFPDVARTRPELVARHYARALDPGTAGACWLQAIELAIARQGDREAIGHFDEALVQMALLSEAERATTELALRLAIGPAMMVVYGFADARTGENYARASALALLHGEPVQRFAATWGDWLHNNSIGHVMEAARRSEALVVLSRDLADPGWALQAHHSRWTNGLFLGRITEALEDTRRGIDLYDAKRHAHHKHAFGGHDPGVCALNFGALSAWQDGCCDFATERVAASLAMVEGMDHPVTTASSHLFGTLVAHCRADADRSDLHARRLLALCRRHGVGQWIGIGLVVTGAVAVLRGSGRAGLDAIDEGLEEHAAHGPVGLSMMLACFAAEACVVAGEPARALALLDHASALSDRTGLALHRSEVERLRVNLRHDAGLVTVDGAVDALFAAAALAQRQGARALVARIAASVERLEPRGERGEALGALIDEVLAGRDAGGETPEIAAFRTARMRP